MSGPLQPLWINRLGGYPVTNGGTISYFGFWFGGYGAVTTPAAPAGGTVSFFGFWYGGLSAPAATGDSVDVQYWNGSSWANKPVKYWNGSSWSVRPVKYWNGSSWI